MARCASTGKNSVANLCRSQNLQRLNDQVKDLNFGWSAVYGFSESIMQDDGRGVLPGPSIKTSNKAFRVDPS
ncbi:uncharacterized protein EAF01_002100 [Botrytis porri]|uniref:uncharacterized protein n=1 Tax=Botrytis porri TaxID=87229 RepID=UPI0018FF78B8|nr:uncharacterized protein EAF01_002100 [Botrytis porri]KAF7910589.1 hypothetical protein EAF01_002100 [Botrytis porri]